MDRPGERRRELDCVDKERREPSSAAAPASAPPRLDLDRGETARARRSRGGRDSRRLSLNDREHDADKVARSGGAGSSLARADHDPGLRSPGRSQASPGRSRGTSREGQPIHDEVRFPATRSVPSEQSRGISSNVSFLTTKSASPERCRSLQDEVAGLPSGVSLSTAMPASPG